MKVSDCCYAPVKWQDVCSACGEHCTPVQEGMSTDEAAHILLTACNHLGVVGYVHTKAQNTDSIYIRFADERIGTCTVRTHPTKARHRIRWNLVENYHGKRSRLHKGTRRFFFSYDEIHEMAKAIAKYKQEATQ